MTMADTTPTTPAKKTAAKRAPAKKASAPAPRKTTHVVMTGNTYDAQIGDVVAVTPETAERLIANGHAREPQPGEVKAAKGE